MVALVPLVVATLAAGGAGRPDVLVMVSGVVAMVAAVLAGYAAGVVVASLVMVPIVAAGFYALLVVGSAAGEGYAVVAPVLYLVPELGQRESPALVVVRIAVFVAVAVAAAGLATRCVQRAATGTAGVGRRLADVALYLAVPVVLITATLLHRPAVFAVDEKPDAVCQAQRGIRYCVNAAHASRLTALIRHVWTRSSPATAPPPR